MGEDGKDPTKMAHIGSILPKVVETCREQGDVSLLRIWEVWDRVVGKAVAANAQPWAFRGAILLVHVSSSAWLHQLRFMKPEMIRNVNDALGGTGIREIKFKIGPVQG
jgi:predicted nucleic acid-binding Zn ribbon protein